ncbi:MAG: hypothetical protein RLZZ399_1959 [Verrucomicrobiota bacterium]
MRKVMIYGDSHTRALKRAAQGWKGRSDVTFEVYSRVKSKEGVASGDVTWEEARALAGQLTADDLIVVSVFGTAHNVFGLLKHERPFGIFDPDLPMLSPDSNCEFVPANCFRDLLLGLWGRKNVLSDLQSASSARVYHMMPPPPKEDNDYIRSKIVRYRDKIVGEHDVNDPSLRLSLWRLEMKCLNEFCKSLQIGFISPPEASFTEKGFLKADFYAADATHANSDYGQLVIEQLSRILSGT